LTRSKLEHQTFGICTANPFPGLLLVVDRGFVFVGPYTQRYARSSRVAEPSNGHHQLLTSARAFVAPGGGCIAAIAAHLPVVGIALVIRSYLVKPTLSGPINKDCCPVAPQSIFKAVKPFLQLGTNRHRLVVVRNQKRQKLDGVNDFGLPFLTGFFPFHFLQKPVCLTSVFKIRAFAGCLRMSRTARYTSAREGRLSLPEGLFRFSVQAASQATRIIRGSRFMNTPNGSTALKHTGNVLTRPCSFSGSHPHQPELLQNATDQLSLFFN
jgi:hypothetical protein